MAKSAIGGLLTLDPILWFNVLSLLLLLLTRVTLDVLVYLAAAL